MWRWHAAKSSSSACLAVQQAGRVVNSACSRSGEHESLSHSTPGAVFASANTRGSTQYCNKPSDPKTPSVTWKMCKLSLPLAKRKASTVRTIRRDIGMRKARPLKTASSWRTAANTLQEATPARFRQSGHVPLRTKQISYLHRGETQLKPDLNLIDVGCGEQKFSNFSSSVDLDFNH